MVDAKIPYMNQYFPLEPRLHFSIVVALKFTTMVYHGEVVDWHNKKVSIAFDEPVAGLDTTYTYPELIIGIIRVKFPELVEHLESRT